MSESSDFCVDKDVCRKVCPIFKEHPRAKMKFQKDSRVPRKLRLWVVDRTGQPIHECGSVQLNDESVFDLMFISHDNLSNCIGKAEVMVYMGNIDKD